MANPLGKRLLAVSRPARYTGGEFGAICKTWDSARVHWVLAFPEVYEIGMSHLGLQILYDIINSRREFLADRVFTPWFDMEELLRREGFLLWGIESGRPLSEFDVVGISISYELTYTNIVTILKLGGINPLASARGDGDPLVIGGGCGAFNPEPVADFFDAILLGDGEEAVLNLSDTILSCREKGAGRHEMLKELGNIEGVYIPEFGKIRGIRRAVVFDLNNTPLPKKAIVSNIGLVHDRIGVEIQRGCTRSCRFCQAGVLYRPVRQRGKKVIVDAAERLTRSSGLFECALLSLSAGDYSGLADVIAEMDNAFGDNWVHISLPSLRTESLTSDLIPALSRSLQGGFTLAPEAATERIRRVINKGNTEEDLLNSVERIFKAGWKNLKLYFMIGLPTETEDDIDAIISLVKKALYIGRRCHKFPNITVNVSTFVPKSHTPFQWEGQISVARTKEIHAKLARGIRGPGLKLKLHSPEVSFLEGVFSRGGRELSNAILAAHERGCRFDAWDDQLKFAEWMEVFKECGIYPESYLAERPEAAGLPWDHLFEELDKNFLRAERRKAFSGEATSDCSRNKCTGCGACDFENIFPRVMTCDNTRMLSEKYCHSCESRNPAPLNSLDPRLGLRKAGFRRDGVSYLLRFTKRGDAIFIGHLDLMDVFRRALRRARLPLKFSEGFSPRPKLSFAAPLPLGIESIDEWCEIHLVEDVGAEGVKSMLSGVFPEGIEVIEVCKTPNNAKPIGNFVESCSYKISIPCPKEGNIEDFYASDAIVIEKATPKGVRKINLKSSVISLAEISSHAIEIRIKCGSGMATVYDFARWFFALDDRAVRLLDITKERSWLTN